MLASEKPSKEAAKLKEMIQAAIEDQEITTSEYEKILALAQNDQRVDAQERQILSQLQELMTNGVVRRVPG